MLNTFIPLEPHHYSLASITFGKDEKSFFRLSPHLNKFVDGAAYRVLPNPTGFGMVLECRNSVREMVVRILGWNLYLTVTDADIGKVKRFLALHPEIPHVYSAFPLYPTNCIQLSCMEDAVMVRLGAGGEIRKSILYDEIQTLNDSQTISS